MHPFDFVIDTFGSTTGLLFEFSKYVYKPQAIDDEREIFTVTSSDLTWDFFHEKELSLRNDQEIALHSRVRAGNKYKHIPMVDLDCDLDIIRDHFGLLREMLFSRFSCGFHLFASGNSAHIYGDRMVSKDQWLKLKGLLLLCNMPGDKKIVDDRWIGHRLIAGYSSLRITCNSTSSISSGKKIPELIVGLGGNRKNARTEIQT